MDGNGYVYVADSGNSRIQKFTSYGYYLGQWGSMGGGDGQFDYPYGVACDNAGNVYVADTADCLVQEFTSGGTYITQWGGYGSNNGQLKFAEGIAVDKNGEVYVADTANDRIEVFYLNILAVAQYLTNTTLAVQSTPPTGLSDRLELGRWRHDELHRQRGCSRDEREPDCPGDGPDRLQLLAVDGERCGADRRAEVHYVRDARGRDRSGAIHANYLHAGRAVHDADRSERNCLVGSSLSP